MLSSQYRPETMKHLGLCGFKKRKNSLSLTVRVRDVMTQLARHSGCKHRSVHVEGNRHGTGDGAVPQPGKRQRSAGDRRDPAGRAAVLRGAAGELRVQQTLQRCLPPLLHTVREEEQLLVHTSTSCTENGFMVKVKAAGEEEEQLLVHTSTSCRENGFMVKVEAAGEEEEQLLVHTSTSCRENGFMVKVEAAGEEVERDSGPGQLPGREDKHHTRVFYLHSLFSVS